MSNVNQQLLPFHNLEEAQVFRPEIQAIFPTTTLSISDAEQLLVLHNKMRPDLQRKIWGLS